MLKVLLVIIGITFSYNANAGSLYGAMSKSCGYFLQNQNKDRLYFLGLTQGYLTAVNQIFDILSPNIDIFNGDVQGYYEWIKNYCKEHPIDTFAIAVFNLYLDVHHKYDK